MELDEAVIEKIEALKLLTGKPEAEILNEALESYLQTEQKRLAEDELERQRKETTLSYDEFWDGVDI